MYRRVDYIDMTSLLYNDVIELYYVQLRLHSLQISLSPMTSDGHISYKTHVVLKELQYLLYRTILLLITTEQKYYINTQELANYAIHFYV